MAENVPSRALLGLSNALNLTGQRSAPAGIELTLPSQPVHDLTPYVRYGSAMVFNPKSDGWFSYAANLTTTGAVFANFADADWSNAVSGSFGIPVNRLQNFACWIYAVSVQAEPATALADVGTSFANLSYPVGITGPTAGANKENMIFSNGGHPDGDFTQSQTLTIHMENVLRQRVFPAQWGLSQTFTVVVQGNTAVNVVVWKINALCRLLPLGIGPMGIAG